ncbi:histidine kinase [Streptomyces abyssalis]|uniref:histidine kinase n=1 Tax=Streptomyces abyssalis TaxID=933944 RepID=A0A1E7JSG5_9ACTN|nr:sensor histidine kinase [Streptomyces abyssalis]OEU91796.1 histidine kinase [Streptomyces abyssalis]OEU94065.1 histidine kinase [Streptomyces abyssalis]
MSWTANPSRVAYGRHGLVLLLTFAAVQYGAVSTDGGYVSVSSTAAVLCGLALLARSRLHWSVAPLLAAAATGLFGWPLLPLLLLALFDLAARRRTVVAMGCGAAVLVTEAMLSSATSSFTLRFSLLLLIVVGVGQWVGKRREVKVLNAQVEHLLIERELREEAARAAERSRIAAEMHDVLAHRLSLIALHTGVLSATTGTLPEVVAERLALLRTASTEALGDLRDILGALHGRQDSVERAAPAPVLREVGELVEEGHTAGQQIEMNVEGQPSQAPTVHRLAVYRLVQEALTNARKHAGGAPVTVRIDYGPPVTVVEVTNGPGSAAADTAGSGFGLVGLRERVTALGGRLQTGPDGAGTWRLAARIPYSADIEQNGVRT